VKVSIVIPVLDSHEVVRRQMLHFGRIGLPAMDDVELIIVDDGSDPPLDIPGWAKVFCTNDPRPWTWALARNDGARIAQGQYLLMTDIDHILSKELIDYVRGFDGQKVQFKREFGVLDENGLFTQDMAVLKQYGLKLDTVDVKPLPNNFAMRRDIFWKLGGYREDLVERPYPQGEDRLFKAAWARLVARGESQVSTHRPTIYVFPNGKFCGDVDANPFGLFHSLSRKTRRNYWYRMQRQR
jgi:hypothetical protein